MTFDCCGRAAVVNISRNFVMIVELKTLWIMNDLFELVSVLTRAVQKCAHAEVSSH
jgi:hypothetical protein